MTSFAELGTGTTAIADTGNGSQRRTNFSDCIELESYGKATCADVKGILNPLRFEILKLCEPLVHKAQRSVQQLSKPQLDILLPASTLTQRQQPRTRAITDARTIGMRTYDMGGTQTPKNPPESRVLIIMTGGTICMRRSENGFIPARGFLEAGMAPRPSFNDGSHPEPLDVVVDQDGTVKSYRSLRTPLSTYEKQVRYSVYEFEELLDSSSIDAKGWAEIAQTIFNNYQLFDAFVVLHGTDSLAYTCSALSFMLENLGKPVILTGSQAPMLELQNDATDNLLGSLVIAGHFMIPEVCLFFNYKLFRGNRATKVSATDFAAFASPNHEPLASITSVRTHVSWALVYRPTNIHPFTIRKDLDLNHVACLRIFPGIKPEMVDAVLRVKDLRGLVLETFGAGNAPGGSDGALTKVIADAVRRGIVVVNITQCMVGSVSPLYAPATALGRSGVVFGHDMTSEAALTKLSYLLALNLSPDDVTRRMSTSIRGELTESSQTLFTHPNGQLTPKLASLAALGYTIAKGDLEGVRDIMRSEREWLLNEADYSGNTPLHLAATGPNLEILRDFLSQGASVHLRNRDNRTPLFLAAKAGCIDNVRLLRRSGAHLHQIEFPFAGVLRRQEEAETGGISEAWALADAPILEQSSAHSESSSIHSDAEHNPEMKTQLLTEFKAEEIGTSLG